MESFMKEIFSTDFLTTVIRVFVPLMFAAMSAYVAALAGISNIAVEGIMLMSALMAVLGSYWTGSAWLGLLVAVLSGVVMALVMAGFTMRLGTSPILVGIALNTFSVSFTVFLLYMVTGNKGNSASIASHTLPIVHIPFIKDIPVLGQLLSGHYTITYFCYISIIAVVVLVYKMPFGKHMRASGLDEKAARSVGINVNRVRLIAIIISGVLAALGGAYMTTGYLSLFSRDMIAGRGWIGIAAQAMGGGNFLGVTLTTILFSFFQGITNAFAIYDLPSELINVIPYVGVLIGTIVFSIYRYMNIKRGKLKNE